MTDTFDILVRKADLDDYDDLAQLVQEEGDEQISLLYNYPRLLTLFERSYIR
jgi:hypothetical protein